MDLNNKRLLVDINTYKLKVFNLSGEKQKLQNSLLNISGMVDIAKQVSITDIMARLQLKEVELNFINASGELAKYQVELSEAIVNYNNANIQHKYLNAQVEYYDRILPAKNALYDLYSNASGAINLSEELLNSEIDVSAKMKIAKYKSYLKDISGHSVLFNSRKNKVEGDVIIKQNIANAKASEANLAKQPYLLVCSNTLQFNENGKHYSNVNDTAAIINPVYPDNTVLGKTQYINIHDQAQYLYNNGGDFKSFDLGIIDRDSNLYTGNVVLDLNIKYYSFVRD